MDYQHFTSFNLTDPKTGKTKSLTFDFDGIIININEEVYERECMPQINFTTDKNDMMDGERFIDAHYGIREINITCFFEDGDLFELKKWLGKKYQQIFNWEEDDEEKGILAIESGNWKSQVYYTKHFYGKIELKFICHNPYYFKIKDNDIKVNEGNNLVIGTNYKIKSKGNSDSYPLIKITPQSTSLSFKWNDLTVTLSSLTSGKDIYLDCEKNICYEITDNTKVLATSKFSSTDYMEFPEIYADDDNYVKLLSGSINSMVILPNTRII